jgi:hypothetical protein
MFPAEKGYQIITTNVLTVYEQAIEELFGPELHQRVHLGHNNSVESRYSLLKDFIREPTTASRNSVTYRNTSTAGCTSTTCSQT